jgi:uncharacterized membrane protein (GlpM family)
VDPFFLKLFLSFIAGSIWVVIATVIAEKHGSKIGGLILGLPSTIVLALFFIGWTESPQAAVDASVLIPIMGAINTAFVLCYLTLAKKGLFRALTAAFILWFILSATLVVTGFSDFALSIIIFLPSLPLSIYLIERVLRIRSEPGREVVYTHHQLLFRGLFTGSVIASAVFLSKIGGPVLGGVFSMFPAMGTSTIVVTHLAHGPKFSSAVIKVSVLSGIAIVIYGFSVMYCYPRFGLELGTIISLIIAMLSGFFVHHSLNKRMT